MEATSGTFMHRTVGEVVAEDYRRASVFKRYGIDFCCGGGISVAAACERRAIPYDELERALIAADRGRSSMGRHDARTWTPDFLTHYIENIHHTYVRESLPVLIQFAEKVARVHGSERPELVEVAELVYELTHEMEQHMLKEERVLFPHVRDLVRLKGTAGDGSVDGVPSMQNPIDQMEAEHDHAGALMARIRDLTSGFRPPDGACATYRATFAKLEEFEEDLHLHVHLENNVLFPRVLDLEKGG